MINLNYKTQNNVNFGAAYPVKIVTTERKTVGPKFAAAFIEDLSDVVNAKNSSYPNANGLINIIKSLKLGFNFIPLIIEDNCYFVTNKTKKAIKEIESKGLDKEITNKKISEIIKRDLNNDKIAIYTNKNDDKFIITNISKE